MQFKRLFMRNFLAVGEQPVEITFPQENGITLVRGFNNDVSAKSSNGAGKSSIVEAVLFSLYGKTLRNLNQDEVVNTRTGGPCRVELEYDNVKIVRVVNPKKARENTVEIYVDGVLQGTDASLREIKKVIEKQIKVNFETMCNILIFGQHNIVSFLDAGEAQKREIVESLMNLREYNLYEEKAKLLVRECKTKIKILSEKFDVQQRHLGEQIALRHKQEQSLKAYQENLNGEISAIQRKLESIPSVQYIRKEWERYNASVEHKQELEKKLNELTKQKNDVLEELDVLKKAQEEDNKKQLPLQERHADLLYKDSILEERKRKLCAEILDPLVKSGQEQHRLIELLKIDLQKELAGLHPKRHWDGELSSVGNEIARIEQTVAVIKRKELRHEETCPECYGKVDLANADRILALREKELAEKRQQQVALVAYKEADQDRMAKETTAILEMFDGQIKIHQDLIITGRKDYEDKKNEIEEQFADAKKVLAELMTDAQKKIIAFQEQIKSTYHPPMTALEAKGKLIQNEMGTLQREIFLIKESQKPTIALEEVSTMEANAENDRKLLEEKKLALKKNPFADIISSLSERIYLLGKEVDEAERAIKSEETNLPYLDFWHNAFGPEGIKSFVVDQIIPTLNEQVAYWMEIIYEGSISVKFDKYLNVEIRNNSSNHEMVFGQGSGGERRRIDLAIMLAFRQVMQMSTGKNPSIMWFDEVGESLDTEGVHKLYEAICDIAKQSHVYVITHNPHLLGLMSTVKTIDVIKKNGEMRLR